MEKITNGSPEPSITIRFSLNEDIEFVGFKAKKKRKRDLNHEQQTLNGHLE